MTRLYGPRQNKAGPGGSRVETVPRLDYGLVVSIGGIKPFVRMVPRVFHGPRPATGTRATKCSDECALEVRRLHAHEAWAPKRIAEHTGLPLRYIRVLLAYTTRGHLDPGPRPTPTPEAP